MSLIKNTVFESISEEDKEELIEGIYERILSHCMLQAQANVQVRFGDKSYVQRQLELLAERPEYITEEQRMTAAGIEQVIFAEAGRIMKNTLADVIDTVL